MLALAVATYAPLSVSAACSADAAAAAECAAICARTNCPMHRPGSRAAGASAARGTKGECSMGQSGGSEHVMVVLAHGVSTMPPAVFSHVPHGTSRPLAEASISSRDFVLQIDAPPPRV
jgi:hypothetical protein